MIVLKSPKELLWSSTDRPIRISRYIQLIYLLQLQNAKLTLSDLIITSLFNKETSIYTLLGILPLNNQIRLKNNKVKEKKPKNKPIIITVLANSESTFKKSVKTKPQPGA